MVSRGELETKKLREKIEYQLNRLLTQLKDLEELKADFEEEEYFSIKEDTLQQLSIFEKQLDKWKSGDITLIDDINRMQIAIRNAVSQAFQTPEVIKMFADRQPLQLRARLAEIERDRSLNKVTQDQYWALKVEVLSALSRLGAELSEEEKQALIDARSAGSRSAAREGDVNARELLSNVYIH